MEIKRNLSKLNTLKVLILPLVVYILFYSLSGGRFGGSRSMLVLLRQCVYPTLIAWAVSSNMVMGVWDFSPGSIMNLAVILGVGLAKSLGLGMEGMVLIIMISSPIMTMLNFAVFHFLKIPSIISNIGMMMVYESAASLIFRGEVSVTRSWTIWARAPYAYIILGLVFLIVYFLEKYTKFGHDVRSLGNGDIIASNIGVNLAKTRFKSFLLEGIVLGFAGVVYISYQGSVTASLNAGSSGMAFSAILAVFIGMYLEKYSNRLVGIFIGAYTIKMMSLGIITMGLPDSWQTTAIGMFLVLFLGFAKNQNRFMDFLKRKKVRNKILQL